MSTARPEQLPRVAQVVNDLQRSTGLPPRISDVAAEMGLSASHTCTLLRRAAEEGLIEHSGPKATRGYRMPGTHLCSACGAPLGNGG